MGMWMGMGMQMGMGMGRERSEGRAGCSRCCVNLGCISAGEFELSPLEALGLGSAVCSKSTMSTLLGSVAALHKNCAPRFRREHTRRY